MLRFFLIPLGFFLIFYGPTTLWQAESQHRAQDFAAAQYVTPDTEQSGHIKVEGTPEMLEGLDCPAKEGEEVKQCMYVSKRVREFTRSEKETCTTNRPDNYIKRLEEKCDSKGDNCKPCYLVEVEEWKNIESETSFAPFKLGNYEVPSEYEAIILGTKKFVDYIAVEDLDINKDDEQGGLFNVLLERMAGSKEAAKRVPTESNARIGDLELSYQYIAASKELLVSGVANRNQEIGAADEKTFVISTYSEAETMGRLESQDTSSKWMYRIMSLFMVVFGFMFIFNTIAAIPLMLVKIIPFLGKPLHEGLTGVVNFIAGTIGLVIWGLMFGVILVLKNIVALAVIFGAIGLFVGAAYMFAKKEHVPFVGSAIEKPQNPPNPQQ